MKTRHQYLLFFYWVALLADCYLIYAQQEHQRWITKGALMPLLLIYYFVNSSRRHHRLSKALVLVALALAWAGDIALLKDGQSYFVTGLALFLAMHLVYIIYFWRMRSLFPVTDATTLVVSLAGVAIFDAIVLNKLLPLVRASDPSLVMPIIVYVAVISVMVIMACNVLTSKKAKTLAVPFFIPGSALFVLSDTLLGFNKFLWEDSMIGIGIILTYGYAQHLLVHGFIKHVKGKI